MTARGTYAYCIVASARRPPLTGVPKGLPGMGPVRWLDVDRTLFLAVADAPLDRYGEEAIHRGLSDLQWVSRVAVAHDAVVAAFSSADAVLPMKLFTIFTSDERAIAHVRGERRRIAAVVKRVAGHQEWGARVVLSRKGPAAAAPVKPRAAAAASGVAYLSRKKADRDAAADLAARAHEAAAGVFKTLSTRSRLARKRADGESPQGGSLLLDASFLVPRSRAASFKTLAARAPLCARVRPDDVGAVAATFVGLIDASIARAGAASAGRRHPRDAGRCALESGPTLLDLLDRLLNKGVMARRA